MAAVAPAGPVGPVGPRRTGLEAEAVLGKAYDLRLMRRLARYVRPHATLLIGWVAFMAVRTSFELAQPAFIPKLSATRTFCSGMRFFMPCETPCAEPPSGGRDFSVDV